MRLHCKQITKFQQNRSTSATATASLVRSLKSIVSTIGTGVIVCQVCVRANGKNLADLKSVFKMSTVCTKSNASSKTRTPLPDRFIDDHLVEMFSLFEQARLQLVDVTWLRYTRYCSFHQIWWSTGLRSGLLAGHRAGVMKSGVSRVNKCHCLKCFVGWTPECLTACGI